MNDDDNDDDDSGDDDVDLLYLCVFIYGIPVKARF